MIEITFKGTLTDLSKLDFKEPLDKISKYMQLSLQKNFQEGGRPNKWQQLKSGAPSHLYQSGRLYNSISSGRYEDDYAWAGIADGAEPDYAWAHNYGYYTRNLPQREYVLFQDEDIVYITSELQEHIVHFWNTQDEPIQ